MTDPVDRRPIASRNTGWAKRLAVFLSETSVTPNQISIASMFAAASAGILFYFALSHATGGLRIAALLTAALFCQIRLICNLLDGMVAVEANKGAADGAFWNEAPDRVSDLLIFLGIGYGLGLPYLGWAAAAFAILTAYIRELGRASGVETDFSGPMAKPQRMALVTGAAVIACFEPIWTDTPYLLYGALWGVVVGSAITAARRSNRLISALKSRP